MTLAIFIVFVCILAVAVVTEAGRRREQPKEVSPEDVLMANRRALFELPDPYSPEHPDLGQHDVWKRVLRDCYVNKNAANLDPTLAVVLRTQGYFRMAKAACPHASTDELRTFLAGHEHAVQVEAAARFARNVDEATRRPGMTYPSVEETIALHTWVTTDVASSYALLNPLT